MLEQKPDAPKIATLQRMNLRDAWPHEALDFTPWLADNIHVLGDTIGQSLDVQSQEHPVGSFRADIVALDVATNSPVLIENQLEKTDHSHLGQLLIYASGLRATTVVWVASEFTEEHRSTLDWLNEISYNAGSNVRFFGLEVELWRIGDSNLACKFNVVCKPNAWRKSVQVDKRAAREERNAKILELYATMSNRQIADILGVNEKTVRDVLSANGIRRSQDSNGLF